MKYLLSLVLLFSWILTSAQQDLDLKLDDLVSPEDQKFYGIQKLNDSEKEYLRKLIINLYLTGYEAGKKEGIEMSTNYNLNDQTSLTTDAIESQIDGEFEGWEGETIIKLMNGQIWQQTEYYYYYTYSFMPKVLIYKSGVGYKMKVDGVDKAIDVTQIK